MANSDKGLRCVHCGAPVLDLFYRIGQDIRLRQCTCGEVVDHYIEFEILLVFIDMQLLRREVYRHVLFNRFSRETLSREAWRFFLLCLILDTYTRWSRFKSIPAAKSMVSDWLRQEHGDWAVLAVTLLETATYLLCVSFVSLLVSPSVSVFSRRAHVRVWEAVLVSSFGKVYTLIGLVWGHLGGFSNLGLGPAGPGPAMAIALALFVAASNIMAVEAVLEDPDRGGAALAVALANVVRIGLGSFLQ